MVAKTMGCPSMPPLPEWPTGIGGRFCCTGGLVVPKQLKVFVLA